MTSTNPVLDAHREDERIAKIERRFHLAVTNNLRTLQAVSKHGDANALVDNVPMVIDFSRPYAKGAPRKYRRPTASELLFNNMSDVQQTQLIQLFFNAANGLKGVNDQAIGLLEEINAGIAVDMARDSQ